MKQKSIKTTIIGLIISASLMFLGVGMILLYLTSNEAIVNTFQKNGEKSVQHIASQIDPVKYQQFLNDPTDNNLYQEFVEQLNSIRKATGHLYVYTLAEDNNSLRILIDGIDDPVPINSETTGTQFEDVEPAFRGELTSSNITTDQVYGDYISSFAPIRNASGEVIGVLAIDVDANLLSDVRSTIQMSLLSKNAPIILGICLVTLISIVVGYRILNNKINPLTRLMIVTQSISEGNISEAKIILQENESKDNNEIGSLYRSTKTMTETLEQLTGKMNNTSSALAYESQHLGESLSEVKRGTNQVTSTMKEMATAAESESVLTSKLHDQMNEFTNLYEQTTQQGNDIAEAANKLLEDVQTGSSLMDSSKDQMEDIYQIITHSAEQIRELDQQIKQINSLISLIRNISEQTNLLSLNASIEAARAGEFGRGFAVVAGEVGKLSNEVANSVDDITSIIKEVSTHSIEMVGLLEKGLDRVSHGRNNLIKTGDTFYSISHSVTSVNESIMSMREQLSIVKEKETEINNAIIEVAAISEENTACIQEVAASTEVMGSSVESLDKLVINLQATANELRDTSKKFT